MAALGSCLQVLSFLCVLAPELWLLAGILYAKYKTEKLMEHLKLFSHAAEHSEA